ncbi:hypothetical protein [Methylobacterium platani]|uniref:Uncharacterized protein n=2 Tax=Methylobacterium platani TaxID=427683 RepID=A0A179RXJ3_9HYPH|nr:hypothetical protein [Methylobacterium platani]KMO16253.1 hypothetical protein SQ03_15065 [Methylobacterium platani JCM 14648]OAS13313.1 hypothetical protein A5481_31120 [Methylobacterium platani]
MSTRQLYRFTATAGPWVAGYRHDPAAGTIALTPEEAELDLLAGTIVPDGTPTGPIAVPGAVVVTDRVAAIRGARDYDFTVAELVAFLAGSTLGDELRGTLRDGVAPDRDTLAKLSAALDAAVVLLRAGIATRAPASALADKADAGANANIRSLEGLTTPLSLAQGGTGGRTADGARAALGLPLVPGDPGLPEAVAALYDAWVSGLPVWTGDGPVPVARGRYYRQGAGGPPVQAQ